MLMFKQSTIHEHYSRPDCSRTFTLIPAGHTFCHTCVGVHMDRHKKVHCPVCRKKVDSRVSGWLREWMSAEVDECIRKCIVRKCTVLCAKSKWTHT